MKKKLLILAIGALAFVNNSFAQPTTTNNVYISIPGLNGPGPVNSTTGQGTFQVFATGTVNNVVVTNFALTAQDAVSMNTIFTVNGQQYGIVMATNPSAFNPLQNGLYDAFVVADVNGNGVNNVSYAGLGTTPPPAFGTPAYNAIYNGDQVFGNQTGNYTVVAIPFDFSTTAVLAAGAFIAFASARRRRKELGILA